MDDSEIFKAIRANNIDGVKESMENCDFSMRDNDGRSLLQMAVMENTDIEIFRLMLEKVDIGIRDVYGETVSDLIVQEAYRKEAMEDIMKYLIQLGRDGNIDKLTTLLLNGWNQWSVTVPEAKEISEEFGDFVEKIEEFQNKVKDIHKAIQEGRERDVKSLMDRKLLAVATDQTGMPPLQKAVVFNNIDMVEFIITEFPGTVSLTDNMGRTALHYAGGSLDGGHLYNLIKDANADEDKKDVTGKTPKDYYENPEQLSADTIKEKVLEMQENAKKREEEWAASQLASNLALGKESKEKILAPRVLKQKSFSRQPVRMYISQDIYAKRTVPPPTTVDGKYISKNVGSALTMALAEIAELRPWDPIEYLAQWLYKYQANMDYNKRQEDLLAQIRQDEKDLLEEEKMRVRRKEEQQQIQEKEEMKRKKLEEEERRRIMEEEAMAKAREEALAKGSMLSTVAEDKEGEEESLLKDRDEHGQTELHKLASQQGADLVALINMNYSLADRDGNNQTARDIAEENNIQDNVESIDAYISNLIEQEKLETIQQFLLDGYDKLMVVLENVSTEGLPSEVIEFIESLPVFQEKISAVFRALDKGEIRTVAQVLDRKKLVLIKDVYGRSPLHIAVLRENQALVKYIVKHYPISAKCRDNMNRTPLHYAMAISNDLAYLLISYKADQEAKDVKQRKPEYYKEARDEILKLKESLPAVQAEDNSQKGEVKSEPTEPTNVPSVGSSGQEVPTTETAGDEEEVN